jgi:ATP-dependent DNA ligase
VFDLLAFGGYDLRKLPLIMRIGNILAQGAARDRAGPPHLRYSEHFEKNGESTLRARS